VIGARAHRPRCRVSTPHRLPRLRRRVVSSEPRRRVIGARAHRPRRRATHRIVFPAALRHFSGRRKPKVFSGKALARASGAVGLVGRRSLEPRQRWRRSTSPRRTRALCRTCARAHGTGTALKTIALTRPTSDATEVVEAKISAKLVDACCVTGDLSDKPDRRPSRHSVVQAVV
jgi:hypothetical protein